MSLVRKNRLAMGSWGGGEFHGSVKLFMELHNFEANMEFLIGCVGEEPKEQKDQDEFKRK